jgi:hypothetical protein
MNKFAAKLAAVTVLAIAPAAVVLAAPANAAPAPAVSVHPNGAQACDIYVVTENAYVRENPSSNSVVRKTKYAGEQVTDCSGAHASEPGGEQWTAVDCSCATDGIGWIISRKLSWVGVG